MTSQRNTPEKHARFADSLGACRPCDKQVFLSRKAARRVAARLATPDPRPRAYRCPVNEAQWHVGHVPAAVRQGVLTRRDWDERRGRR